MKRTTKMRVIEMIERLPDDASIEDILMSLETLQSIEIGRREIERGETISHEEVKAMVNERFGTRID